MQRFLVAFLIAVSAGEVSAQEEPLDRFTKSLLQRANEEYRLYFKRPETVIEYWSAIKFEMEVGKLDLAALHLKLMLDKIKADPAGDKELAKIEEADGLSAFLRLKDVAKWSDHPPFQKEAEESVKALIDHVGTALDTFLSDPARIKKYIDALDAPSVEERNYAFVQLNRSRERATPYLVDVLRVQVGKPLQRRVFDAMLKMRPEILPPLYEILKARDPNDAAAPDLRLMILDLLDRRGDTRIIPYLWYLTESPYHPNVVRAKAKAMLARMLDVDPQRLRPAKIALTELAERFYQHKIRFPDPKIVKIWPWDGANLALKPVDLSHSQAEEIFGMRYAQEALSLDPTYKPAQMALLSLMLDRKFSPKVDKILLEKTPTNFQELLSTIDSDLLIEALERGLNERNPGIALPIIRALGERGEVRAARASSGGPRGIVKALYYPDRRVQYAALQAMLRMPAPQVPVAAERIVDVLRRFLATGKNAKALVLFAPDDQAADVRQKVKDAGFEPVLAKNMKEAFEQLSAAADFDVILVHQAAPDSELPFAMTQLRGDIDIGLLPTLLFSTDEQEPQRLRVAQRYPNVWVVPVALLGLPEEFKKAIADYVTQAGGAALSQPERDEFTRASMDVLWRMSRGEIAGYNVRAALPAVVQALQRDDLAVQAAEIIGRMPGTQNQERLADIVLDPTRDKLRTTAAIELNRHVQKHGVTLDRRRLLDLKAAWQNNAEDAALRSQLALVMGSMRSTSQQTGTRLYQFDPFAEQK